MQFIVSCLAKVMGITAFPRNLAIPGKLTTLNKVDRLLMDNSQTMVLVLPCMLVRMGADMRHPTLRCPSPRMGMGLLNHFCPSRCEELARYFFCELYNYIPI